MDQVVREKGKAIVICTEALQQLQEAQRISNAALGRQAHHRHTSATHAVVASSESYGFWAGSAAKGTGGGPGRHRVKGFIESAAEETSKCSGMVKSSEGPTARAGVSTSTIAVVQHTNSVGGDVERKRLQ